ncbi:MAG: DUF5979 domain-containing protein [Faecousia sp.]
MYGRRYQRKRGFKRVVLTLLSFVMLVSLCFPAMWVNAEEGTENPEDYVECTCYTENGIHAEDCPKYVAPQNGGEGDIVECTCGTETDVHEEGCALYVKQECTCGTETDIHEEGCALYVKQECTCGTETDIHEEGCALYVKQECTCGTENDVHEEGCALYVKPECTCGTETDIHEEGGPLYVVSAAEERTLEDMLNEEDYQGVYAVIMSCEDDSEILDQYLQEIEEHPNGEKFYDFVDGLPEEDQLAFKVKLGLETANTLEELPVLPEDLAFISVQKTFVIDDANQLPADFQISVDNKSLGLNDEDVIKSEDHLTYMWKVTGLDTGTYTIKETNCEIVGYDGPVAKVIGSDNGDVLAGGATVTVKAAAGFITDEGSDVDNSQGTQEYDLSGGVRLINFKGSKGSTKTVVISKRPLSGSERLAIENAINNFPGTWKDTNPSYYSLAELELNKEYIFSFDGVEAKFMVTENDKVKVTGDPKTMNQTRGLTVDYTAAENGDIHITNTYKKSTTDVEIEKQVTGNMADQSKDFSFTVTSDKPLGKGSGYTLSNDNVKATFTLRHGETITLQGVPIGAKLSVTEDNAIGYDTTIKLYVDGEEVDTEGIQITETMSNKRIKIVVTNDKDVTIDTGITTDSIPYILLFSLVAIGAGVMLLNKRRYDANF